MQVLLLSQVRLTKVAEVLRSGQATEWQALGLDEWLRSPVLAEMVRSHPGLEADLRRELEVSFSPRGTVKLAQLAFFPGYTIAEYWDRAVRFPKIQSPFENYTSPGVVHVMVFMGHAQYALCTPLPTDLYDLRVESGEGEPQHLITRDTLARTDLDGMVAAAPEEDGGFPVRLALREIVDFLAGAKRSGADVVATVG